MIMIRCPPRRPARGQATATESGRVATEAAATLADCALGLWRGDAVACTSTDARAHLADGPHLIGHRSDGAIGPTVRRCPWEQHRKQEDADATEAPRVICD